MKKRMRSVVLAVMSLIFFLPVSAQPPGYRPVTDSQAFGKRFAEESAKVMSIVSDFRQDKHLTALEEKMTSTGKFWFRRTNLVRIDYEKPFSYRLVMNGDNILLRDGQKDQRFSTRSNSLFLQINRIIVDCIQGTVLKSPDFSTKAFENGEYFLLELKPTGKGIREFFSMIHLYVDKRDYSVASIEMHEPGGDKTVMFFVNKKLNQQVNDEVFAF